MQTKPAVALTDLPMIKQGRADRLVAAGVSTIEQLVKVNPADLASHEAFAGDEGFLGQVPLLQGFAKAHARNEALVYCADERLWGLNEPIIHMDLEFDGQTSEIFLYGMLDHHTQEVTQWFEHSRKGQEKLLRDFRDLCRDQRPTMVTWGGRSSDTVQLRRACEKYGMRHEWLNDVAWLDLQNDMVYTGSPETQRVYLPVRKFKSDVVAAYFGYEKPKLAVRDGYHALRLYRTYKRGRQEGIKKDLCTYNAEDLWHLRIILEGLRDIMQPLR